MGKVLVYLGGALMLISTIADGIVILDTYDDLQDLQSGNSDWYIEQHFFITVLTSIATCSISLLIFAFL